MKYNFGLLIGKPIHFYFCYEDEPRHVGGKLKRVKQTKDVCQFIFDKFVFTIQETVFVRMKIKLFKDEICFIHSNDSHTLSGLFGFTMFDTYGFPIELTQEMLGESGMKIDREGFDILRQVQKGDSKKTFVGTDCFS